MRVVTRRGRGPRGYRAGMSTFTAATTLDRLPLRDDDPAEVVRFTVDLDPAFRIATKPHGGYLLALCGRAATDALGADFPHVVAASAHFLRSPDLGRVELVATVLRRGRSASQVQVHLVADGAIAVAVLLTCGRLAPSGEMGGTAWWQDAEADATTWGLPAEGDCVHLTGPGPGGLVIPFREAVEQRLDPAGLGFGAGTPGGMGVLQGWLRPAGGGDEQDPLWLLLLADALPPATFDLGSIGWVPTLELTVYVRAVPAPGPFRVRQRAVTVTADRVDEVCEVVDSLGTLVATGHQLAGVRLPEGPPPGR